MGSLCSGCFCLREPLNPTGAAMIANWAFNHMNDFEQLATLIRKIASDYPKGQFSILTQPGNAGQNELAERMFFEASAAAGWDGARFKRVWEVIKPILPILLQLIGSNAVASEPPSPSEAPSA